MQKYSRLDCNLVLCHHVRYLQVRAVILGDKGAVALAQHRDLLLDVFDLVLRLLQVDGLDGHHFLGAIVDAFEHLAERALANALQLGEQLLRVGFGVLAVMGGGGGRGGTKQGRKGKADFLNERKEKTKGKGMFEKN